jgi:HEAT repeat protein
MGRRDKRFFLSMRGQKSIDRKAGFRYGIFMRRKKWLILLLAVLVLAGLGWWQRTNVLSWYYVRQLIRADKESREDWVKRVAGLDEAALPRLLSYLESNDEQACDNVGAALIYLVEGWGPEDERSLHLVEYLETNLQQYGKAGKEASLQIPAVLLHLSRSKSPQPRLLRAAGEMVTTAAGSADLSGGTLTLAAELIQHCPRGPIGQTCRDLGLAGLKDAQADNRIRAVNLVICAKDPQLLTKVVPLLKDPAPQVRKAALAALGPAKEVIGSDDLLPLLHDADVSVQKLAEEVLCSRGLPENQILLARLISDERPGQRLQVVHYLLEAEDLPLGIWLRRLSQDPAPAVRAAAVRAAYYQTRTDLRDRLGEMAREDPSPTVRQLAHHYLNRPPIPRED